MKIPADSSLPDRDAVAADRRADVSTNLSAGLPAAVSGATRHAPLWATLIATFFGIGRLRPGPGTWGSAAAVMLWAALGRGLTAAARTPVVCVLAILITLIGIPAATQMARSSGKRDPQFVVIDEVAGQLIALIAAPLAWKTFLAGFILFRAFDIVKPPPLRQLEKLPEGTGIVLDDVAAGLYAFLGMQLVLHFGLLT
jgi:phosphatidylglycerophosphatase A